MKKSRPCTQRLHELIDTDLPAGELERLGRVDALLRAVARPADRDRVRLLSMSQAARPRPRADTVELQLTFGELTLIYKSLQAAKALGALPPQDELLDDTIHLVDQALKAAI